MKPCVPVFHVCFSSFLKKTWFNTIHVKISRVSYIFSYTTVQFCPTVGERLLASGQPIPRQRKVIILSSVSLNTFSLCEGALVTKTDGNDIIHTDFLLLDGMDFLGVEPAFPELLELLCFLSRSCR